jgi:hypothetical protein
MASGPICDYQFSGYEIGHEATALMTDRLTLAHAFEDGGMSRGAAEKVATEIYDAIRENVATKADLRELEERLKFWLITRLGVLIVAGGGALFGALHCWPPILPHS